MWLTVGKIVKINPWFSPVVVLFRVKAHVNEEVLTDCRMYVIGNEVDEGGMRREEER